MALSIGESYTDILAEIKQRKDVNANPGSVISDLFLTPVAVESTRAKLLASLVSYLQSIDGILFLQTDTDTRTQIIEALDTSDSAFDSLLKAALDHQGANVLVDRRPAQKATGIVSITRNSAITIPEQTLTVPAGTIISTSLSRIQYRVTKDTPYIQTFFDNELGFYTLVVPVEAVLAGTSGNAAADTITVLETSVPGFTGVTNKLAIANGLDEESDVDYADRIKTKISANNKGSEDGYKSLILDNIFTISNVSVIQAGDPEMTRDRGMGGKVDIYLREQLLATTTETYGYTGEIFRSLANVPVQSVISVIGDSGGDPSHVFVEGVDWSFIPDSNIITKHSSRANDRIQWLGATIPNIGSGTPNYTVTLVYDSNVQLAQNLIDTPEESILNADVLVKEAEQVLIDISFTFFTKTGFSKSILTPTVQQAIESFVDGLKIDQSLFQSDIIKIVENIDGVRNVSLPFVVFNKTGDLTLVDEVKPGKNSVIVLNNLVIA